MCLVILASKVHPEVPLVVAANRDELFSRPAEPVHELEPGIAGGRDVLAGGTWLAANRDGVVAALTNQPLATKRPEAPEGGRDPAKRSRGELPLVLARHPTAELAVRAFAERISARDYNPCALLVADSTRVFYIGMLGGDRPDIRELASGIHVLENRPIDAPSPKADHARAAVADMARWPRGELVARLGLVLADRTIPADAESVHAASGDWRPASVEAAFVVAGPYGTRTSNIVLAGATVTVYATNAPPGTAPFAALPLS
ncbi:MAG: NRDE family protein [Myxococcota bacterium]